MNLTGISNIRLINQQITGTKFKSSKQIVGWMGAMQAQDFAMAKWAIGIRLSGSTENTIEDALNKGEIIRTHLLRPTWHFVSSDDIYWMLNLTAPQIKSSMKSRHKQLEIHNMVLKKTNKIIEKALAKNNSLTREELISELKKSKIATENNRASHIFLTAELDGLICSGEMKENKQTYTLLEKRVPVKKTLSRDEALVKLSKKYFLSHGPATLKDFVWWAGLPVKDAKHGLESIRKELISETIDLKTYWFSDSASNSNNKNNIFVLPAYDEFIISYRNRSAVLDSVNHKKTVSNNGVFRPVILINGKVTGIWKRTTKKDQVIIEPEFLRSVNKSEKKLIAKEFEKFGHFLNRKIRFFDGVI